MIEIAEAHSLEEAWEHNERMCKLRSIAQLGRLAFAVVDPNEDDVLRYFKDEYHRYIVAAGLNPVHVQALCAAYMAGAADLEPPLELEDPYGFDSL